MKKPQFLVRLMTSIIILCSIAPCFGESLREQAAKLIQSEKFDDALNLCRDEFRKIKSQKGPEDDSTLDAAGILGTLELLMGHPNEAEAVLKPAFLVAASRDRNSTSTSAHLANEAGVASYQLAKFEEAKRFFTTAVEIRQNVLGSKDVETLQSIRNLGWAEEGLGDFQAATTRFKESYDGLVLAIQEPVVRIPFSSDAVILTEWKPNYPRVVINAYTGAPGPPSVKAVVPPKELGGWVLCLSHLHTLQQQLGIVDQSRSQFAMQYASAAFGPRNYQTFLVHANCSSLAPRPDRVPAPFGFEHPVMANVYLRSAISEQGKRPANSFFEVDPFRDAERAASVARRSLGVRHPLVSDAVEMQGLLKQSTGDLEAAITDFEWSLATRKEAYGPKHPRVATSLATLGVAHYYRGNIGLSRTYLEKSLEIFRATLGENTPMVAAVSSDLASVARRQGDYALARRLLEESIATFKKSVPKGVDSYQLSVAEGNLAVVQIDLGDFETSAQYFSNLLEANPQNGYAKTYAELNLAVIARLRGKSKESENFLKSILTRDPTNLEALSQLGGLYRDIGDYEQAGKYLNAVLTQRTKDAQAQQRPEAALAMSSIGLLYLEQGKPEEATQWFLQSHTLLVSQVGATSKLAAEVMRQLGTAYLEAGNCTLARQCLSEALQVKARWADEQLPFLSEADAIQLAASIGELDPLLSAIKLDSAANSDDACAAVWIAKAAATRAVAAHKSARTETPEIRELTSKLRRVRSNLSRTIQSREVVDSGWRAFSNEDGPRYPSFDGHQIPTKAEFEASVTALRLEKERLERELAAASPQSKLQHDIYAGTPVEVQALLPLDAAIIDFVKTKVWSRNTEGKIRREPEEVYEAFILRSNRESIKIPIARISLGSAKPIDDAIAAWRAQYSAQSDVDRGTIRERLAKNDTYTVSKPDQFLSGSVWGKLLPALNGIKTCILIPDGDLSQLPFGALPGKEPGQFLVEQIGFVTIGFGQQLLALLADQPVTNRDAFIVGNVAFDKLPTSRSRDTSAQEDRSYRTITQAKERSQWPALPGTREEALEIQTIWKGKATNLSGADATKSALIDAMPRSRYVHLATHGFFSQEPVNSVLSARGRVTTANGLPVRTDSAPNKFGIPLALESLVGRSPLVLSGIVLAGANLPESQGDSIVTAEELVDLDLSNTELVTLSACETGLGTTAGGEGVFGLQRALSLAGARSSIATLWQVDDAATKALMVEFYRNLWTKKMSRLEALREAQLRLLRGELNANNGKKLEGKRVSPYYWAAFVLSGDWR